MEKVLVPLHDNDVAPRFDLATDVLIVFIDPGPPGVRLEEKVVVLAKASAEELCRLVMSEDVNVVVCGGIPEEYHQFLTWKGVRVLDGVMGPVDLVLQRHLDGALAEGDMLYTPFAGK